MSYHAPTTKKVCPDCNEEFTPGGYHPKRCDRCGYKKELTFHRNIKTEGVFSPCCEPGCTRMVNGSQRRRKRFCFEHGLARWKASVKKTKRGCYHHQHRKDGSSVCSIPSYRSRALAEMSTANFLKAADAICKGRARIIPPPESPFALPVQVDPATDPKPYGTAEQNAWKPEYSYPHPTAKVVV